MMFGKVLGRSAIVAAALLAVTPASATNFIFSGNSNTSGTNGLTASTSAGGITVTASAWSTTTTTNAPQTAFLGIYGGTLGVTNRNETGGSNTHSVSNTNGYDFIRLEFSTAVKLTGMVLNGYNVGGPAPNPDTDAWVSYGSTTDNFTTDWNGFLTRGANVASGSTASYTGNTFSTVWLIGADRSGTNRNDGFKIGTISAVRPPVPEPSTWLTMILGFGAIGTVVRKRSRVMAKVRQLMMGTLGRRLLTGPTAA